MLEFKKEYVIRELTSQGLLIQVSAVSYDHGTFENGSHVSKFVDKKFKTEEEAVKYLQEIMEKEDWFCESKYTVVPLYGRDFL